MEYRKEKPRVDFVYIGVLALIFATIFNTSKYGATLSWCLVPGGLIVIGGMMRNKVYLKKSDIVLLCFWAVFTFSTFFSRSVSVKRDLITFLSFCIIYIFATRECYSQKQIDIALKIYMIVTAICEINVIFNWLSGNYYNAWYQRASFQFMGVYKDPNYAMSFVVPGVLWSFIYSMNSRRFRIVYLCFAVLGVTSILASGSRGAIVTIVLSVFIYLLFSNKKTAKSKLKIILFSGILLLLGFFVAMKYLPSQAIMRFSNSSDDRIDIWRAALASFYDSPIWGNGMNSATILTLKEMNIDSHNVYLDILCGSGIIGTVLFLVFFISRCVNCKKDDRSFIWSSVVAFMLPMFFINGFNTATFYLPLIMLSIFCDYSKRKENNSEFI